MFHDLLTAVTVAVAAELVVVDKSGDDEVVIGSDLGMIGGPSDEDSGYQVNIPETCLNRALCHMLYPARPVPPARVGH